MTVILVGCSHKHSYVEKVVAPTCTEKGYTEYKCLTCDDVYTDKEVEAKGHTYGDWVVVKNATEDEEGIKERFCSVCGFTEEEIISKQEHEHKYNLVDYIAPTCTCI